MRSSETTKSVVFFLALFVCPVTLLAEGSTLVEQLRLDLVGKSFSIRVPIAASTCLFDPGVHRPTPRLVDTEMGDDHLRYYLRADRFMNIRTCNYSAGPVQDTMFAGIYIDPRRITNMHGIGQVMTVKQVEAKPDRIEIQLTDASVSGDNAYGKLKLMFGKGYETKTLEQIEMSLARALEMPRIRELILARKNYGAIQNEIASLKTRLPTMTSSEGRVAGLTRLLVLYQQEPDATMHLNRVAFVPIPVPENAKVTENTRKALEEAQQQVEQERLEATIRRYAASSSQVRSDCERLPASQAASRNDLNRQVAAVASARQDLTFFEHARGEMINLGQNVPQGDEDYAARCISTCESVSKSFPAQEQVIRQAEAVAAAVAERRQEELAKVQQQKERAQQIASLDEDFRKMKRQRAALDTKLVTVLGGPDEAETFSVYRSLLETMIQNRQQAAELGAPSAEQETQTLTDQLRKLQ